MSKLTTLAEAVSEVNDGDHVALGGFAITRNVVAASHELIRADRKDLRLTQVIGGMDTDLLVGSGSVSELTYSGGSLDRFGFLAGVNDFVAGGRIRVREYSSLALTLRLHAGALGLPFVACRSMLGSDLLQPLLDSGDVKLIDDPFTGEPVLILAPLRPDVAFVHADVCDERGNAALAGPTWTIKETAFAARRTIVLTEKVVPIGSIAPESVLIPAAVTHAVVELPHAAHPTAVLGQYDYDRTHLEEYAAATRAGDDARRAYLDKYVLGTRDHADYLQAVGLGA